MKKDSLKDYLLYIPLSIICALRKILPIRAMLFGGMGIGRLVYRFALKRRKIAGANLKAAFGKRFTQGQREKIIKSLFEYFGLNIMELFLIPKMDDRYFKTFTRVHNFERVAEAVSRNKGVIYLAPHYGNWELAASISANNGYPIYALAREQRPYFLNNMLNRYRQIRGTKIIQKGMQLREIIKILKYNGIIGIIGDQSGRQGREMYLFGRPLFMADGAFRIAAATGSVILPAFNHREGFYHHLIIEEPIVRHDNEDTEQFIKRGMMRFGRLLERYISKHPQLWLWGHRRWKHTRSRRVVVLTDGKAGHTRQAQAVSKAIAAQRKSVKIIEVEVLFKNSFARLILQLFTLCLGAFLGNTLRYMRWALHPKTYEKLESLYADIVICCGSSTRAVALLFAKENMSKTISVMRPAPFPEQRFDLCIVAQHDKPRGKKNVFVTRGALNLISPVHLRDSVRKLKARVKMNHELKIGILIGGSTKHYVMDKELIDKMLAQIKRFAYEHNAQLLLSTSRRTPAEIDTYIRKSIDRYTRCIFKVFPNEENFDYAVGGILGVSSVVVVTGESISMVSEAASSGAYTIVVPLPKRKDEHKLKHDFFLDNLTKSKSIRCASKDTLYHELSYFVKHPRSLKRLDEAAALAKIINEKILQ